MVNLVVNVLFQLILSQLVATQMTGQFTNPSGPDGSNTYIEGQQLNIAWSGTEEYYVLSMGIFSTANDTISWFITNYGAIPQTTSNYLWTVDVTQLGFGLAATHLFQFLIVNGTDFGNLFNSDLFQIEAAASSTTTSSSIATSRVTPATTAAASTTVSGSLSATTTPSTVLGSTPASSPPISDTGNPIVASPTSSPSAPSSPLPSSSSSALTTGAKIGLGVGIPVAIFFGFAIAWWILRCRRKSKEPEYMVPLETETHRFSRPPIKQTYVGELDAQSPRTQGLSELWAPHEGRTGYNKQ
ncbi:MAG: hypothetical protein MMC33_008790 [Icmadophila ericetorum]|nr:hypothetical protein [Icmadophila ericetorum]